MKRARTRGGVIVEALVVTPLFIILASMGFYAFRLHNENLALMRSVREPLWASALAGCNDSDSKIVGPPAVVLGLEIIPETLPGGPNQLILITPIKDGTNAGTGKVTGDNFLGQGERTFRSHAEMMCNAPVEDGQLTLMRFFAAEELK